MRCVFRCFGGRESCEFMRRRGIGTSLSLLNKHLRPGYSCVRAHTPLPKRFTSDITNNYRCSTSTSACAALTCLPSYLNDLGLG